MEALWSQFEGVMAKEGEKYGEREEEQGEEGRGNSSGEKMQGG